MAVFVEILIILAAVSMRAARERGRRPGAWLALSVVASVCWSDSRLHQIVELHQ